MTAWKSITTYTMPAISVNDPIIPRCRVAISVDIQFTSLRSVCSDSRHSWNVNVLEKILNFLNWQHSFFVKCTINHCSHTVPNTKHAVSWNFNHNITFSFSPTEHDVMFSGCKIMRLPQTSSDCSYFYYMESWLGSRIFISNIVKNPGNIIAAN